MQIVTSLLLESAASAGMSGRLLVLGGEAALPNALSDAAAKVSWIPVDVRERDTTSPHVVVVNDTDDAAYDRVVIPLPADRGLARRWLLVARRALAPGGEVLLAGANAEGAKAVIADATAVFGQPISSGYRQKHRIASFTRPEEDTPLPSWASTPGIMPGTWQEIELEIAGEPVTLHTQPGVFAGDRLDAGTRLLLDHLEVRAGCRVLDVGCGAGAIGIAASRMGAGHVDLVDANLLAVQSASRNLTRLGISGRAFASDVYKAVRGERYDLIVSNPPFHRGKQVDLSVADRLIAEAPEYLLPGGRILLVANAFLAYGKQMQRVFRRVETVAATRQYHVLMATDAML